jgi:hypothetical protein
VKAEMQIEERILTKLKVQITGIAMSKELQ